jgi:serine/threonine protein kinase/tetratricopeptide (TPR) repeat protein
MASPARSDPPSRSRESAELVAGRYEVEEVLGRGGMGAVYRVRDRRDGAQLALKRLLLRKHKRDEARALFEREFHTLAQLRHPRIIAVHDYGIDAQGAYYTMELLAGADMRQLAPLPWPLACKYLREVATSLVLLHARKLVHRDVTPQNVRVGDDGHCKLIDFGTLADFGTSGSVIGTPPCVPPEAVDGKPIDQRLDLYALGCLGYWMLTGGHAYPATDSRQLRAFWARTPAPPSQARPAEASDGSPLPAIPAALDALVMALLALDPLARPSSATAVIDRLDAIASSGSGAPGPSPSPTPSPSPPPELGSNPPPVRKRRVTRSDAVVNRTLAECCFASAPLCGRGRELGKVKLALERSMRGRGASVVISGPQGIGRTRCLAEVELRAQLEGLTTLRVNAADHPQVFGTVRALIAQLEGVMPPSLPPSLSSHRALHARLTHAASKQPLALLIDDVHRADEASLGVLGQVAHEARHLQLALICTRRSHDLATSDSAMHGLLYRSTDLALDELREPDVAQWLSAVLGEPSNLGRLCSFLHARTGGRPGSIAALLRFLITSGALDYRDGTWLLPNEPSQLALPDDVEKSALERLRKLPEPTGARALALAEALSLHRDVMPAELCTQLAGEGSAALFEALVGSEIWIRAGDDYRFASEAIRKHVLSGIDAARRGALHARMAELMLARSERTVLSDLAAGVHMLEARDRNGLALTTDAARTLINTGEHLGSAVHMLERALELGRELGMTRTQELALLAPLGLGAYVVDHRLVRHEAALASALDDVSGLPRVRDWYARFGAAGAALALVVAFFSFYLRPGRAGFRFRTILTSGVVALVGLAGRATITLDKASIDRIYAQLRPLRLLGWRDPGGYALAYIKGLGMTTEDRYERTYQYWLKMEAAMPKPGSVRGVTAEQIALWKGGASYVLGIFEGFRGDPRALERARELEQSGDMHALIASQIRLQYHGFRGEAEQVRNAYERMEAAAIRAGSSWQVETWSPIAINLFAALWHDIVIVKHMMHETRRQAAEIPSIARYALTAEALYLLRRGQPRDAVELFESVLAQEAPLSRIGWSVTSGLLAEAYNELGMHEEARALCERVLSTVSAEDRPYYAMRVPVEIPYALALSALGEHDRASAHLNELLACYGPDSSPAALGSVHEALARVALARRDRKGFTEHLKRVEALLTHIANPALIARFQALTDLAGEGGGILTKIAVGREVRAFEATMAQLQGGEQLAVGARHILTWLMRSCEGYDGYLFVRSDGRNPDPLLLAATSEREPHREVFDGVAEALDALGGDGDTTSFGTAAATRTRSDGSTRHLFLLSYLEADSFHAEGALVLLGRAPVAPPVRYELLQAAALQLRRLNAS